MIDRGRVAMEKKKSEIASAQELIEYMEDVARPQRRDAPGRWLMTETFAKAAPRTPRRRGIPAERPLRKFLSSTTAPPSARSPSSW